MDTNTSRLKIALRLFWQLLVGIDTLIGLCAYVVVSSAFGEGFDPWFLAAALAFAYLPDFDLAIFFFLLPKRLRRWGHWRLGFHHPLFFLPISVVGVYVLSRVIVPEQAVYLAVLAAVGVVGHFVHDSTKDGMHWFSPISRTGELTLDARRWLRIKFSLNDGIAIVPQKNVEAIYQRIAEASADAGVVQEIGSRLEVISSFQFLVFVACCIYIVLMMFDAYLPLWLWG